MSAFGSFKQLFRPESNPANIPSLLAGSIHHYTVQNNGNTSRLHLRIDPDGSGVLIVNANTLFHLNPSAARMAYLTLEKIPEQEIIRTLHSEFHASQEQITADYLSFKNTVDAIIKPDGKCPICDLEIETNVPFSHTPSAPYRMDLALTYRCNNDCSHCYNERPRDRVELSPNAWKEVLEKLWEYGIPHIVFTGGEPTLVPELPDLIHHAESIGEITGLNTNGRRLKDQGYASSLVEAGLDHVQITLESHREDIHDRMVNRKGAWQDTTRGIQNALNQKLFVMTNTTLLKENAGYLEDTLKYLGESGVPTVGLNALIYSGAGKTVGTGLDESELPALLETAREITARYGQRLIWYTPTQYCHFDPVQMQLGIKGCTAALYNMCIEPDGSVIPCQSYYTSLGNILLDSWPAIWEHPLAQKLRNHSFAQGKCLGCSFLSECGGGCPLALTQSQPDPSRFSMEILK